LLIGLLLFAWHGNLHAAKKELNWAGCSISELGFMKDLAAAYEEKTGVRINLDGGGATKGIREVASFGAQLGSTCRMPLMHHDASGKESIDARENNIKIIPVGWDALVAIVNQNNTMIDSISREQLKDVLTGKITHWKQLGADSDLPINLYVRPGKVSGVGLTLRQQLFNNRDQDFAKSAIIRPSSGRVEEAVVDDPYGMAVSGISSSRHRAVNMLKLEGVEPNMETLRTGKYFLYRLLFLVVTEDYQKVAEVNDFVEFALSSEGQRVIRQAGTLPYHQGISLLFSSTSQDYLHNIDTMERHGIYTLSNQ
jgi:phosphate transport system substrate-binding protein